ATTAGEGHRGASSRRVRRVAGTGRLGRRWLGPAGPGGRARRPRSQEGPPKKATENGRFPAGFAHFRAISAVLEGQNGRFRPVPDSGLYGFVNNSALRSEERRVGKECRSR